MTIQFLALYLVHSLNYNLQSMLQLCENGLQLSLLGRGCTISRKEDSIAFYGSFVRSIWLIKPET